MTDATVVWFRRDLRLADNPALGAAIRLGKPVIPLFVWDPEAEGEWAPGAASRWWLHRSLASLDRQLRTLDSRLTVRAGPTLEAVVEVAANAGASAVHWNRRYEPAAVAHDTGLKAVLRERGIEAASFNSSLLNEPHAIRTRAGTPFKVFTPFYRHCASMAPGAVPEAAPATVPAPARWPRTLPIDDLGLEPTINWAGGLGEAFEPGEPEAQACLAEFADGDAERYADRRDLPADDGVSRLSPHLHHGEVSPLQVWHAVRARPGADAFVRQLYWREFAHHLLFHFPESPARALAAKFERFPWRDDDGASVDAWRRGLTGYPLVDAGMRELWATGWMHNRVRMNAASFLVKHLLVDWRVGARWFWDTLVDADLANNTMGWQWVAGCGADAAPFFRIFNPTIQGQRFDPAGTYVRRWVPELGALAPRYLHAPAQAPAAALEAAGVRLGETYPLPIVDHRVARQRALDALASIRDG